MKHLAILFSAALLLISTSYINAQNGPVSSEEKYTPQQQEIVDVIKEFNADILDKNKNAEAYKKYFPKSMVVKVIEGDIVRDLTYDYFIKDLEKSKAEVEYMYIKILSFPYVYVSEDEKFAWCSSIQEINSKRFSDSKEVAITAYLFATFIKEDGRWVYHTEKNEFTPKLKISDLSTAEINNFMKLNTTIAAEINVK